jgi:hypothetical protein
VFRTDGCCIREIKTRIFIAKDAFNRKILLLPSKLVIELKRKIIRCCIAFCGSVTSTLRKVNHKYSKFFEIWCWKKMDKIK